MNEKYVLTRVEIHKNQVIKLNELEGELISLISKTENEELMNKFLDWQSQRLRCNETFTAIVNTLTES